MTTTDSSNLQFCEVGSKIHRPPYHINQPAESLISLHQSHQQTRQAPTTWFESNRLGLAIIRYSPERRVYGPTIASTTTEQHAHTRRLRKRPRRKDTNRSKSANLQPAATQTSYHKLIQAVPLQSSANRHSELRSSRSQTSAAERSQGEVGRQREVEEVERAAGESVE